MATDIRQDVYVRPPLFSDLNSEKVERCPVLAHRAPML